MRYTWKIITLYDISMQSRVEYRLPSRSTRLSPQLLRCYFRDCLIVRLIFTFHLFAKHSSLFTSHEFVYYILTSRYPEGDFSNT